MCTNERTRVQWWSKGNPGKERCLWNSDVNLSSYQRASSRLPFVSTHHKAKIRRINMSDIGSIVNKHRPDLAPYETLYKYLHANPELSYSERETASTIRSHLSKHNGLDIHTAIGGHGIAATLSNGSGPTVLLRADTDALPVLEKTGLPYASTKRMKDAEGKDQPVMHACGHDMHTTSLLAAAELLHSARDSWSGTLVLVFQPAEEKGSGAKAMVEDGLYSKKLVPIPDVVLGAHVMPYKSGLIGTRAEVMASAADSMKITLYGRGGHASQPHRTVDPVVMAAYTVARLQTLVSREVEPSQTAVVTVASIRAGETENIIAEEAEIKVNVRTFDESVREKVLAGVKRIVKAESEASGATKQPEFQKLSEFPITWNDEEVTAKLDKSMKHYFEDKWHLSFPPLQGSEDFSVLGTSVSKPCNFWVYGGTDPELWDCMEKDGTLLELPINHSAYFAPVIQPTLRTAVDGYAVAALTWLTK